MGIRIPTPIIESGTDCSACTPPAGDLFPVGETPKYIYVKCMLMDACPRFTDPLPNGVTFKLMQDELYPCHYEYEGPTWKVSFWFRERGQEWSLLELRGLDGDSTFTAYDVECPFEYLGLESDLVFCAPTSNARFGMAIVWWNEDVLELMEALNIAPSPRLMSESFWHEDGDRVVKFCDKRDATNIKIKYSLA